MRTFFARDAAPGSWGGAGGVIRSVLHSTTLRARRVCTRPMPAAADAAQQGPPDAANPQDARDRADLLNVFMRGPPAARE